MGAMRANYASTSFSEESANQIERFHGVSRRMRERGKT